ncbi:MAG TPA: alkaline phosphatase family protein [Burkholderiales bacterium]|nr:alkaline phosphatase family protein [Burkholderiales bacterium]
MTGDADTALANLARIDHLVVLIMENRSFDHMLGYLSLAGRTDVDGLKPGMSNTFQPHAGGPPTTIPSHRMLSTGMADGQDPCHAGACVDQQIANGMSGFVQNYHDHYPNDPNPGVVMGYYDAAALPVYDFLAKQFAIADRWFASVPGETWPNRLYAVSGRAMGGRENSPPPLLQFRTHAFVRELDALGVTWKGYGDSTHYTIRQADENYRASENFEPISGGFHDSFGFIRDARTGQLPAVSLLDPHFFSNDDHPPADVRNGQALVARIYDALASSPNWNQLLFVIVYDEHGGFFDHVDPADYPTVDDDGFNRYGVRVPAFFIGPYVDGGVCHHSVFDHTSLIKTILLRFCARDGAIPDMGKRVAAARHVGEVLARAAPRAAPPLPVSMVAKLARLKAENFTAAVRARPSVPSSDEVHFIAAVKETQRQLQGAIKPAAPRRRKGQSSQRGKRRSSRA